MCMCGSYPPIDRSRRHSLWSYPRYRPAISQAGACDVSIRPPTPPLAPWWRSVTVVASRGG